MGHIHEQILRNALAVRPREKWDEFCRTNTDKFSKKAAELEQEG